MDFKKYNNLVDLFFEQYEKQSKDKIFLSSLKEPKKNFSWNNVKLIIEQLANEISKTIQKIQPRILYFPFHNDIHSDHRIISEAVLSCSKSFRYEYIKKFRAYEVLSETEFASDLYSDSFNPNLWIDISDFIDKKIEIMEIYKLSLIHI